MLLVCVGGAIADTSTQTPFETAQEVVEGQAPEAEVPPLTDPEAASELPHANLDRAEALALLQGTFGQVLQGMAGPFAELEVEKFLSNNVAVLAPSDQPESSEAQDQGTLLESTIPLRSPNEAGEEEQVSLELQSNGAALEAENGLVEAALPSELSEEIELPETGVGIEVEGVAQGRSASTTEESIAFYPNISPDSDLALALTPTGVETLTQLRTPEASTVQTYQLSLPPGAELVATSGGGAEVLDGDHTLVTVPAPTALDAAGHPVPVHLQVSGSSLILEETPDASTTYPALVDPLFETYTWGGNTTAGLENWIGERSPVSPFTYAYKANCTSQCSGFIPDGRPGLWVNAAAGWSDQPGWAGGFHYFVPRWQEDWDTLNHSPTSYIAYATYYGPGFWHRGDNNASPYVLAGLVWPEGAKWLSSYSHGGNEGNLYMGETWKFPGESGAKEAWFGLSSLDSHTLSSARELYIGYITLELNDKDKPKGGSIGSPAQWVNNQATSAIPFSFMDPGLGVYSVTVSDKAGHSWTTLAGCSGGASSPCPRTWSWTDSGRPAVKYDPSVLPQGINNLEIAASDPAGHQSNQALEGSPAEVLLTQVKVDHTSPTLALSGTLTEQNRVGPKLGSYSLNINATDGTEAAPQSGVAKTVVEVDGKVVDEFSPGCTTKNCAISHEWTLDSSKFAPGSHTVRVMAIDAVEEIALEDFTIFLQPAPAPAVSLSGTMTEQSTIGTTRPRYKLKVNASAEAGQFGPSTYSTSFGGSGTTSGLFNAPAGMAVDSKGFIWAVDRENARIQKLKENGEYVTKFGSFGEAAGKFRSPADIAIDSKGNFWIADAGNNRIDKFSEKKEFVASFSSASGKSFKEPESIAVDSKDNVWVADTHGVRIVELNSAGETIRIAGNKGELSEPAGIAVGPNGEVWVADRYENDVVEFSETGQFLHRFGSEGSAPLQFERPDGIDVDSQGNVWVADLGNDRVQELGEHGEYLSQFGSEGQGPGQFDFGWPYYSVGLASDGKGNILVADTENDRIERWQIPSFVPSAAGSFGSAGSGEGQLYGPAGMAKDLQGNLWVADLENSRLEQFSPGGEYLRSVGSKGSGDGQLNRPTDIAIDSKGNIWVADGDNCRVEEFSESGKYLAKFSDSETAPPSCRRAEGIAVDNKGHIWVTDSYFSRLEEYNEAGERIKVFGTKGTAEGQLKYPTGIAIGVGGNLWVSDRENNRVLEFTPEGSLVMQFGSEGSTAGKFKQPGGLDIDERGNVWVVDEYNSRVEEFNHNGKYVAQFGSRGSEPGQFIFSWPSGILADPKGYLWVTDGFNGRIQKWSYASANSEIASEVTIDGKQVDSDKASCIGTSCPVGSEWMLESPSYSVGEHVVKVKATDGLGRSTTQTLGVGVQRDTTKPGIELSGGLTTAPEGWVEQKSYGLTASATDQGGGVTSLAVKIDGSTIASESQGCPEGGCGESITKSPNMASYAGGAHEAEVIATDGAGNAAKQNWTINVDPSGKVSTIEAIETLDASDTTSESSDVAPTAEVVDPAEIEEGYRAGLEAQGSILQSNGTAVTSTMTTDPTDGFTVENDEDSFHIEPTKMDEGSSLTLGADDAIAVAPNTTGSVDTVLRPIYDGMLVFQSIRDISAPEIYSWRVELYDGQTLKLIDEKDAGVFYPDGTQAMLISTERAHDALNATVPTTLAVSGSTISLIVHHKSGHFVYPVVAGSALETGYQEPIIEGKPPGELSESELIELLESSTITELTVGSPEPVSTITDEDAYASVEGLGPVPDYNTYRKKYGFKGCPAVAAGCSAYSQTIKGFFYYNQKAAWQSKREPQCPNSSAPTISIERDLCEWVGPKYQKYGDGYHITSQVEFHVSGHAGPVDVTKDRWITVRMFGSGHAYPHDNSRVCNPSRPSCA